MKANASSIGPQRQRLGAGGNPPDSLVRTLLPTDAEVPGLLALMLLTDAQRSHKRDWRGVDPSDKEDRSPWDRDEISKGLELLTAALSKASVGLYQLQAEITAVHEAARAEETHWPQILALYEQLKRVSRSPW